MKPYACPVCGGRGVVPPGFYTLPGSTSSFSSETCRSCQGTGVLWGDEVSVGNINSASSKYDNATTDIKFGMRLCYKCGHVISACIKECPACGAEVY